MPMVWEDLQSHGHEEPRQELHPGAADVGNFRMKKHGKTMGKTIGKP